MIKIILAYLAIGLLLVTRYSWDSVVWYREKEHLAIPLLVIGVIVACFIAPIGIVVGLIKGTIEHFRNN